jgi:hypothetical protein
MIDPTDILVPEPGLACDEIAHPFREDRVLKDLPGPKIRRGHGIGRSCRESPAGRCRREKSDKDVRKISILKYEWTDPRGRIAPSTIFRR